MNVPRFHIPEAAPGARVTFPEHLAHHAREVLRLRAGAIVRAFDGQGREYEGVLETVTRKGVDAKLGGAVPTRPESPLSVVLALSPLKGDRMELVIQKATELGVTEIRPVVTTRTDAVARPALKGSRQERWDKVASGAAEQCGRATVPQVFPTTTLGGLMDVALPGSKVLLYERGGSPLLSALSPPRDMTLVLLLGPAGGWESSEVERLLAAGYEPSSLGPRILRAETAAVAAVAIAQSLWGDMR